MPLERFAFTVHGTVQGVNFRSFSQREANKLNITGWVRNTADSTVQGEAQGSPDELEAYTRSLNQGPRAAHVTKVEQKPIDTKNGESSFDVKS